MSKIEFEQISEDEIEVILPPETPMEIVEQIKKSFTAKGLVEDLAKSTVNVRYYFRPQDEANQLADELIKSLKELAKDDVPYWHPKAKKQWKRDMDAKDAMARLTAKRPPATTGPNRMVEVPKSPAVKPKTVFDPALSGKVKYNKSEAAHDENDENCACEACTMNKSDYGPKGAKLYNQADNVRRKANNTGNQTGFGNNVNTKRYTSAKFSNQTPQTDPKLKRPQPVKSLKDGTLSPSIAEEIKARANLKKSAWGQHLPFPSAEEEIMKLAKADKTAQGEDVLANQLANLMQDKAMLGAPPPSQPTDEQLFGHLVVTEEMAKANEQKWQGAAFDWLKEAAKPIGQKFASEEEELAYWNSIKVSDRDDGKSGY